jgi:hypothetical protein
MNTDRDKFLTEAFGECWHEVNRASVCNKCGKEEFWRTDRTNHDLSTWEGFGWLWEHCTTSYNPWWDDFAEDWDEVPMILIHPDRFADAVFKFLKERE